MFGTLNVAHDVRQQTPLKFVENRDLSSALSRNSREKPHVSCEFCRSRKVRCSGQPSGCNRCQAVGTQCRYPPREPRRKNRAGTGGDKTGTDTQSQKPKSDSKPSNEQDQGLKFSKRGTSEEGDGSAPGVDPQLLDQEMKSNSYWYQEFGGHGLATPISPHSGEEQGSNDRLDDWLDTNGILESEFPSIPGRVDDFHHFNTDMLNFGTVDGGNDNYFNALRQSAPTTPALVNFPDHMVLFEAPASIPERNPSNKNASNHQETLRHLSPLSSCPSSHNPATPSTAEDTQMANMAELSVTSGSCGCLQLAACLLEELGTKAAAGDRDRVRMDVLLGDFRDALTQCTDILDCERCVEAREINMLLAMSAKYTSTMCQRLAVCYAELKRARGSEKDGGGVGDLRFSTYQIESLKEQVEVLGCLVMVQIDDFAQIIARLKTRPGIRKGHLTLLAEARNKVNALQVLFRGRQDSSFVNSVNNMY